MFSWSRYALVAFADRYGHERGSARPTRAIVTDHSSLLARSLALQAEWTDRFAALIAARTADNTIPDVRAKVIAAAVVAAINVAVTEWLDSDVLAVVPSVLGDAVGLLAEGLAATRPST